ncbi:PREDICTED: protein C2-DOMAIN ABA-RELATED 4-like [Prunus mume]|uniref:Protein C2-DOMAIN ABA-RELATED 4-like n=1 Tax=Prunus mume TaxID=102107 RepID=A0ABM1LPP0_PRUMU|nr:PREDICTED: protein C2-DOMAIN ABA-RELATED 4-like [Prunus mume]XP_016649368.1 PREDICTED: protein C2-DOMAIN ABA-RELATED 4-like [Prunus mume]
MEHLLGLLRVRVQRGANLAIRDVTARTSDPYVVIKMGKQKLKTRVVKKSTNPEWNEDLTLSIADPTLPVNIHVYDKDTFTLDDKMGDAEFEIGPFLEALRVRVQGVPSGTVLSRVQPNRQNCLAEESCIIYTDGQVVQNMCIRLRNVERGELELQLQWIDIPGSRGL